MNAPQTNLAMQSPYSHRNELAARLRRAVAGDVLTDPANRGRYATDASIYQMDPVAVLVPRSQDDVVAALSLCRELDVPVLARGAGTSQCGQTVGAALVIDNSRHLSGVVDFDPEARTVTVQPGMVLDHLNAWLKPQGLWFPWMRVLRRNARLVEYGQQLLRLAIHRLRQYGA